jgi:Fur family transcriptional regulator, peroxide stress response regulator
MSNRYDRIAAQLKLFEDACRKIGLRLTHQRLEIFRQLAKASDHPSVETLYQRLRRKIPTLSLDTVYRTLATFAGYGLIKKVDTVESQARFEASIVPHHHLICRRCNAIMDFDWRVMDHAALPDSLAEWGRIESRNVVIYGVCRDCLPRE